MRYILVSAMPSNGVKIQTANITENKNKYTFCFTGITPQGILCPEVKCLRHIIAKDPALCQMTISMILCLFVCIPCTRALLLTRAYRPVYTTELIFLKGMEGGIDPTLNKFRPNVLELKQCLKYTRHHSENL